MNNKKNFKTSKPRSQSRTNSKQNNRHYYHNPKSAQQIAEGQVIPLKIKRLGINGEGIGYYIKLKRRVPTG